MTAATLVDAIWKLIATVGALAIVAWAIMSQRRQRMTGEPTPEEARVRVLAQAKRDAVDRATADAQAKRSGASDAELEQELNR